MDISPRQTVSVSAALIPIPGTRRRQPCVDGFQHAAPGGSASAYVDPPVVGTGLERPVAQNSGMVVRAERAPVWSPAWMPLRILIDNADEYVLRKFVGLNERTCQNQKPIVKKGQRVKKGPDHRRRRSRPSGVNWPWVATCSSRS